MKELSIKAVVFLLATLLITVLKDSERKLSYPVSSLTKTTSLDVDEQDLLDEQDRLQGGIAYSTLDSTSLGATELRRSLQQRPPEQRYWSFSFRDSKSRIFTYAATGVNRNHYLANSFLLGFVPFETNKVWVPLATLSQRKHYLIDHRLYGTHMQDIWQNSKQAFAYSRGDCEDHAILLADWLISMGLDAKVALGEIPSGGHAWVVLNYQGTDYVLEATSKQKINSINDFILAARATDYRPKILFNRESLWVNTGTHYTTRYRGEHWQLRSRFQRERVLSESDLKL